MKQGSKCSIQLPFMNSSCFKVLLFVVVLLVGLQLLYVISFQNNRWIDILRKNKFMSFYEQYPGTVQTPFLSLHNETTTKESENWGRFIMNLTAMHHVQHKTELPQVTTKVVKSVKLVTNTSTTPKTTQNTKMNEENQLQRIIQENSEKFGSDCKHWKGGNFSMGTGNKCIPECPFPPNNLVGPLKTFSESPPMEELESKITWTLPGGRFMPTDCWTNYKVAVIVPYRNRETQLRTFLYNMHHFLSRQTLDYGIYIVEQAGSTKFNRAMLMNIGYAEAIKIHDYNCFVFHDVDLIPEDDRNFYGCGANPRHLSAAIDKFNYRLPYGTIYGGVSQVPRKDFEKANGFSNMFFGWGGEDDDMWNRLKAAGCSIVRYSMKIARYKMIRHSHEKSNKANPMRFKLLREGHLRFKTDGINSLKYKLLSVNKKKLYTLVTIDLNEDEVMRS